MREFQVTLFCDNGKYKPVASLVRCEEEMDQKTILAEGVKKICIKRLWTSKDLKKYGYTKAKIRENIK